MIPMLTYYGASELRRLAEVLVALYEMGGPCVAGEGQWALEEWHGMFLFGFEEQGLAGGEAFWEFLRDLEITDAPALSCLLRVERTEAMLAMIAFLLGEDICESLRRPDSPEAVLDLAVGERRSLRPYM